MELGESATLAVASLGALTGLLALTAQIWSYVGSGPRVKVTVSAAFSTGSGTWTIGLDATNVGRMPTDVLEVGLLIGRDKDMKVPVHSLSRAFWVGADLPLRLQDGSQASWFVEPSVIALRAQESGVSSKVGGYVRLGTGKTVFTRPVNVQDALALAGSNQS